MDSTAVDAVIERAVWHGLALQQDSVEIIDSGLDFRVAMADDAAGDRWVLRIPRRADVVAGLDAEAAVLELVRGHLTAEVPRWEIREPELLGYRALPGRPGLSVLEGEPQWHMDPESLSYARSLGRLLAELHTVPRAEVEAAGVEICEPDEVRRRWRQDVETVAGEFTVDRSLLRRWRTWLDEDALWPQRSVMTHGELYPAHTLMGESGEITGVLDWTTARVDDPGRDFMHQFALAGQDVFAETVAAYEAAGGAVWPRLAEHCHELWAAGPVGYAKFALQSGDDHHRSAAAALLDPDGD